MIKYRVDNIGYAPSPWKFPAGEVGISIAFDAVALARLKVIIYAAITSSDEVMQLFMLTDALKRQYTNANIHLVLGYTPYGRQDRVCSEGESLSVLVFAKLINAQGYKTVTVYDPHSSVTEAVIDNCIVIDQTELFVDDFMRRIPVDKRQVLIAPDAGAMKKVTDIYKQSEFGEVMFANKVRNMMTGEIIEYSFSGDVTGKHVVVVDDICDGGATFLELGSRLRGAGVESMTLCVTHGIFSKGHEALVKMYDNVYTTNSYHMDRVGLVENVYYCGVL